MSARGRARRDAAAPLFTGAPSDAPPVTLRAFEFYPTPPESVIALLECPTLHLPGGRWLEPCVGTGRIVRAVNGHRDDVTWTVADIDERHAPSIRAVLRDGDTLVPFGDFVTGSPIPPDPFDVCLMNPPFSHALDFVIAAFARARIVAMLQRLNWFAPARSSWLRAHCPDVYALPARPSFTGDGKTDAAEYAWFVWPEDGRDRTAGRVAMLDHPHQATLFPV